MPPTDDQTPAAPVPTVLGYMPPDAETLTRIRAGHDSYLASLNEHDPASLVYRRPDLAQKYRERAEADFQAIFDRHGLPTPAAPTAEELRIARFDENWRAPISEGMAELIEQQVETEEVLQPYERQRRIADLKKEFGEAEYAQMVIDARAALTEGEEFPEAALSNKFVLQNLAVAGRYINAYSRARSAAGL